MKELFIVNKEIAKKKIAIYGTDINSLLLFSVLLQYKVYVNCFISLDGEKAGSEIMNKPVVLLEDINKTDYNIIVSGLSLYKEAEKIEQKGFNVIYDYSRAAYEGDSILVTGE